MKSIIEKIKSYFQKGSAEKGQIIAMWPFIIMGLAAFAGLVLDTGSFVFYKVYADIQASRACIAAGEAYRVGEDPYQAYSDQLEKNGYTKDQFEPKEGTKENLTRGLERDGNIWYSAVSFQETTFFLQIIGIDTYTVLGQANCLQSDNGGLTPVAVRKSAILDSLAGKEPLVYTVLGNDPKWELADKESGTNFRGAIFMHMQCIPSYDPNCPDMKVFYPLTENPPSAQTKKKLVSDCFYGINCSIVPIPGTRAPIVSGSTSKQLCQAFKDAGRKEGDNFTVTVFNGEVYVPDPPYGNTETVLTEGFAVYQVVSFEPSKNNCNHVKAKLVSDRIYSSLDEIPPSLVLDKTREVQWGYQGDLK